MLRLWYIIAIHVSIELGKIVICVHNWNGRYSMPSIQQEWGIFNALHPTRMGDTQCPPIYSNGGYSMPSMGYKNQTSSTFIDSSPTFLDSSSSFIRRKRYAKLILLKKMYSEQSFYSLISNRDAICGLLAKCYKNHETW